MSCCIYIERQYMSGALICNGIFNMVRNLGFGPTPCWAQFEPRRRRDEDTGHLERTRRSALEITNPTCVKQSQGFRYILKKTPGFSRFKPGFSLHIKEETRGFRDMRREKPGVRVNVSCAGDSSASAVSGAQLFRSRHQDQLTYRFVV